MSISIKEIQRRIDLTDEYIDSHFRKNGRGWASWTKEQGKQMRRDLGFHVTNAQKSHLEIHDFKYGKAERYFGYMKKDGDGWIITNSMGKKLCDRVVVNSTVKTQRSWLSDSRIYFSCIGINGVRYIGIGFGTGMCCRIRARKRQ